MHQKECSILPACLQWFPTISLENGEFLLWTVATLFLRIYFSMLFVVARHSAAEDDSESEEDKKAKKEIKRDDKEKDKEKDKDKEKEKSKAKAKDKDKDKDEDEDENEEDEEDDVPLAKAVGALTIFCAVKLEKKLHGFFVVVIMSVFTITFFAIFEL
jgi:DNA mismatch repair ATPase MutL